MKNKLSDLNNHLFLALERLNDDDLTQDELLKESERARVIAGIAAQVISNANLNLQAAKLIIENGNAVAGESAENIMLQLMGSGENA
ncbi:MAG: hypothetical protein FWE97_03380 [Dehalococcoidia bacterium]|nr:hypothetical protein [Dehalococcoidia bacterium]